jgi:hypothetical protein
MSEQAPAGRRRGYLVEHYRPGQSAAELECAAAQVRDAFVELEHEGEPVRFVHSTIVEADESFFCVVEAASEELVHAAYERASVRYERVSAALTDK